MTISVLRDVLSNAYRCAAGPANTTLNLYEPGVSACSATDRPGVSHLESRLPAGIAKLLGNSTVSAENSDDPNFLRLMALVFVLMLPLLLALALRLDRAREGEKLGTVEVGR